MQVVMDRAVNKVDFPIVYVETTLISAVKLAWAAVHSAPDVGVARCFEEKCEGGLVALVFCLFR